MSEKSHLALGMHAAPDQAAHPQRTQILRRARLIAALVLLALLLGALATLGLRVVRARDLASSNAAQGKLYVQTVHAKAAGGKVMLTLPGTLLGQTEAPIYARSSGYVLHRYKDIGSQVAAGELLADLDTPEIDLQLAQAVAVRAQASASFDLAASSLARWEALRQKDAVTAQELNERNSASAQAKANLAAAQANVERLQKQQAFKRIVAPFAGVITHRNIEVGDLVDAGNTGAARALFTLAQTSQLRVYVYLPQAYAQRVKTGDHVSISQKELPEQVFDGTVVRTAGAIDVASRSMQIEIALANTDHALLAGAYVEVALNPAAGGVSLTVPSNVLLFRPEGTRVAIVDAKGQIRLQTVSIGRDLGNALEIIRGIDVTDQLVMNPPDSLAEQDVVVATPFIDQAAHSDKGSKPHKDAPAEKAARTAKAAS